MYNYALITKQQLEELGMVIDLQVVDWATLVQRRNNPQMYDIFTTGMAFVPDPRSTPTSAATGRAGRATTRSRSAWT